MKTRSFHVLAFALACLASGISVPAPAVEPVVPPEKGSVKESGKFVPADTPVPAAKEPDPARRLAELGVQIEGERLKLGAVEVDRRARTVSFPAKVNQVEGPIEYAVVTGGGKCHEALLVTEARPQDIHLACLLIGGGAPGKPPADVKIEVQWQGNGPARKVPLEDLVSFAKEHPKGSQGGSLEPGAWTYTGSRIDAAGFVATREGSIVSLIHDPAALVNNPRPGREDDTLHVPNRRALPAEEFPVRVVFRPVEKPASPSNP